MTCQIREIREKYINVRGYFGQFQILLTNAVSVTGDIAAVPVNQFD
jgi:hypothetical protein